mmetsp:Transcript_1015/g.3311  ORF Transcript_1015/g.3311 Transcript_1015/m.3311 type:complete len:210 (-) Transcript_1015:186-815(-)
MTFPNTPGCACAIFEIAIARCIFASATSAHGSVTFLDAFDSLEYDAAYPAFFSAASRASSRSLVSPRAAASAFFKSSLFSSVVVAAVTSFAHVWWSPTILGASETNRAHATARTFSSLSPDTVGMASHTTPFMSISKIPGWTLAMESTTVSGPCLQHKREMKTTRHLVNFTVFDDCRRANKTLQTLGRKSTHASRGKHSTNAFRMKKPW